MSGHARFPIREWRRAVAAAAQRVGSEAIAPFGFELTGSAKYLSSHLRYLFIYLLRTPSPLGNEPLVREICDALDGALADVARTIEIVDYDRFTVPTGFDASRTLIIRSVDAELPLLRTWARYIVAAALAVNRPRITAVTDFHSDLMAQRYCCQLAIMHDALFAALPNMPALSLRDAIGRHLGGLQRVSLADRFRFELVDAEVVRAIGIAIDRFYADVNVKWSDSAANIRVPDFHGKALLDYPRSDELDLLVAIAIQRYEEYADDATPRAASAQMLQ
ncbi:MAG: hypothetical protein DMF56_10030 [Acidobacteria bacterium]|nr:MAG: hypothetical protein DMF56_10030 [Acidobacteriota bacterium]